VERLPALTCPVTPRVPEIVALEKLADPEFKDVVVILPVERELLVT